MGFFGDLFGDDDNDRRDDTIIDATSSDPRALQGRAGTTGRMLIAALDKAVQMQASVIENYVDWLRAKNPDASPSQIQEDMDKHFSLIATGSGGAAGAAAAFPGIGFITGAAAIGVESLVFLDTAAFYTMACAHLRGVDIRDPERRRTLILVVLLGSQGTAIVDAAIGDVAGTSSLASTVTRFGAPRLGEINNRLLRTAINRVGKRLRHAWIGKIMPLGIGAVLGTLANRKLAEKVVSNARESLGALPAKFDLPAPDHIPEEPAIISSAQTD